MNNLNSLNNLSNLGIKRDNTTPWYLSNSLKLNGVLPSLIYDFASNRFYDTDSGISSIDSLFGSVRTTNAMMYNANGDLVFAPAQMCARGIDYANWGSISAEGSCVQTSNLTPNGNLSWLATWTAPSPTLGLSITGTVCVVGANHIYQVRLRHTNHRWLRVAFYSSSVTTNQLRLWVDMENGVIGSSSASGSSSLVSATVVDEGDGWLMCTLIGTVTWSSTSDVGLLVSTATADGSTARAGNGASFEIGESRFRLADVDTAWSWRPAYATTGSAYYAQRLDYDPATGQPIGYIAEQAITNDVTQSINLTDSNVTQTGASISLSPSTYLGGWSACRWVGSGTSTTHVAHPGASITPPASTSRSLSAIIKPISGTLFQITGGGGWINAGDCYANFDLSGNGSVVGVGAGATNTFIRHLGNGIYHFGATITVKAAPTPGAATIVCPIDAAGDIRIPTNSTTSSFDFIYAGNCAGVGYSNPVPTFGTAATKGADFASETIGAWFDQTQGTFFVKFQPGSDNGSAKRVLSISNGTVNNAVSILRSTLKTTQIRSALAGVADFSPNTANTSTDLTMSKAAIALNSPSKKIILNGGAVPAASVAFPTSGYTSLVVGSEVGSNAQLNGWISEVRYYPISNASDVQLQALTT